MQCLGVAELTGGTALQYEVEVKNKFQTLESIEEETVPNLLWESTRNIMVDVAEKVIGYRKTKWVKPWITEETYSLTEDKRQARQSDLVKYKELKKVVQKSLRKDKDRYITALCEDLEEANDKGNMRKCIRQCDHLLRSYNRCKLQLAGKSIVKNRLKITTTPLTCHSLCMCNQNHLH